LYHRALAPVLVPVLAPVPVLVLVPAPALALVLVLASLLQAVAGQHQWG
jgi:hypothetical protein